jgi:hypothetical protein
MRQSSFINALNVGELSPDAWSRSDLAQHSRGCLIGWNMIGRVIGPVGRRPGTWHVGAPKHHDRKARLIPFVRSQGDALLLEFGDFYVRVWTVNGTPVMADGVQVEFASPYSQSQIEGIRYRQSGDVMFLTHRDGFSPRQLVRQSNTLWSIDGTPVTKGPFRGENTGPVTLRLSGTTLQASAPLFQPGHVGSLWRIRPNAGNPAVLTWEPEEENIPAGAERLSNGRVYARAGTVNRAGNTPPIHDSGTVSDGRALWTYLHDGAAIVQVTAFLSDTQVIVADRSGIPAGVATNTPYWSEGAFSDLRGWPTANPVVREERLALAGAFSEPDVIDFTRTAGFSPSGLDFTPGLGTGRVVDDDAVRRFVGESRDRIVWLAGSTYLIAGTTSGEHLITGATVDDPITPAGCVSRPISEFGSADVMPVLAWGLVMFVASGGQTLRFIGVQADQSQSQGDLSVTADHIGRRGLVELTWCKQPMNLLWVRLADGGQASFTFHSEQNVQGWNRHGLAAPRPSTEAEPLGGGLELESSCVLPGVNGRPRLFMLAKRTKNGQPQRMILRMAEPEDRLFLDAAELYFGVPVPGVAGIDHLIGEPVTMMARTETGPDTPGVGWGEYRNLIVDPGGSATLPAGALATRAYVGLPYLSRWEGLPPDMMGPGTTQGRKVAYKQASIVVTGAVAYVGTTGDEGDSPTDQIFSRRPSDVGGPVVRRMTHKTTLAGGSAYERRIFIQTDHGWDMVIHSVRAVAEAEG